MSIKSSTKLKKILEVSGLKWDFVPMVTMWGIVWHMLRFPSDCLGVWKLHEQQQEGSSVWIPLTESGPRKQPSAIFVFSHREVRQKFFFCLTKREHSSFYTWKPSGTKNQLWFSNIFVASLPHTFMCDSQISHQNGQNFFGEKNRFKLFWNW